MTHRPINRVVRWLLLAGAVVCWLGAIAWALLPTMDVTGHWGLMGTPLVHGWLAETSPTRYTVNVAVVLGILLLLQWCFLRPKRGYVFRLMETGRSLITSILAAAAMAMLLTVAAFAVGMELFDRWLTTVDRASLWHVYGVMAAVWLVWAAVFAVYWRSLDRWTRMNRMLKGLLAGSVLELVVAAPLHARYLNPNQDCHCARGTYTGLVLAGTVLLWCFGPGLVFLFLRERYRLERLRDPLCRGCAYRLKGTIAAGGKACPECGRAIAAARTSDSVP